MDLQSLLRPLGEINDRDTQFTAAVKTYQSAVLAVGIVILAGIIYFGASLLDNNARTGTWRFGLCKVFAEQYISYPTSLKMMVAEERQNSALLEYLTTNAYGAEVSEEMECFYNVTPGGIRLVRVTVNRKSLELSENADSPRPRSDANAISTPNYNEIENLYQAETGAGITNKVAQIHIDEFNKSIGVILASEELDLEMPSHLANNIEDLKYD